MDSAPRRNPDVVDARLADDEAVLLHLESGAYHELNPVGARIWDLVDGTRGTGEITDTLRGQVTDPPEDLEAIVANYLAELRERDLIR